MKQYHRDIVQWEFWKTAHCFYDPGVADFNGKAVIKQIALDEVCRNNQVNDKCFEKLSDVPKFYLTLTVPTLYKAGSQFCSVSCAINIKTVFTRG